MGFWWDIRGPKLACKSLGLKGFCNRLGLLSLQAHHLGRDALEKIFFGEIDTKGAAARDILLQSGPGKMTAEQRCDFARLLLSLVVRRPATVGRLRTTVPDFLRAELDSDSELRTALSAEGIGKPPSTYVEEELGWSLADHALMIVQPLVDEPKVVRRLVNAYWAVKRIDPSENPLVLSDRPLIKPPDYDHPNAVWMLPLTPHAMFIICNDRSVLQVLLGLSTQRFVKDANKSSVVQADHFVFCVDKSHERLLMKHLKPKST